MSNLVKPSLVIFEPQPKAAIWAAPRLVGKNSPNGVRRGSQSRNKVGKVIGDTQYPPKPVQTLVCWLADKLNKSSCWDDGTTMEGTNSSPDQRKHVSESRRVTDT